MPRKLNKNQNLVGKKFGSLKVIAKAKTKRKKHNHCWICICDCGCPKISTTGNLNNGSVSSCGCLKKGRPFRDEIMTSENHKHDKPDLGFNPGDPRAFMPKYRKKKRGHFNPDSDYILRSMAEFKGEIQIITGPLPEIQKPFAEDQF